MIRKSLLYLSFILYFISGPGIVTSLLAEDQVCSKVAKDNINNDYIGGSATIEVKFGNVNILVDSFDTNEVDLDDLKKIQGNKCKFSDGSYGADMCQVLLHVLEERWRAATTYATETDKYTPSHKAAITKENKYRGELKWKEKYPANIIIGDKLIHCYKDGSLEVWDLTNADITNMTCIEKNSLTAEQKKWWDTCKTVATK